MHSIKGLRCCSSIEPAHPAACPAFAAFSSVLPTIVSCSTIKCQPQSNTIHTRTGGGLNGRAARGTWLREQQAGDTDPRRALLCGAVARL